MNVLSLFDGISCARVSFDRAKIPVKTYFACEIDKHAIKVSETNYPDIVRLGDVRTLHTLDEPIDLLVGGSPCTDLSIAKKDRKGLEGEHSSLFWEYVRIWKLVKPRWFILENVASMPKKDRDIITQEMGVEPVLFNASLVSAQCRKRLFWTNIAFELPEDRGILLKDILQPDAEVDESMVVNGKSFCLTASYHKGGEGQWEYEHNKARRQRTMVFHKTPQTGRNETKKLGYVGENDHQAKRVYDEEGKCPALNVVCNSMVKVGYIGEGEQYGQGGQAHRVYDPSGKTPTLSSFGPLVKVGRDIGRRIGEDGKRDDDNTDLPYERRIEVRDDNKTGTLTSVQKDNLVVSETRIRKLTPIECERLQGLPDNYTASVSKTNRYKCLGNAFNVDVIAEILAPIVPEESMPYKLRKAPNRELYWVVSKETGDKHSKEPLPKPRAEAQMRALYRAEGLEKTDKKK
jgi:DNA (cytosine-5)-methyltransferase 3A